MVHAVADQHLSDGRGMIVTEEKKMVCQLRDKEGIKQFDIFVRKSKI